MSVASIIGTLKKISCLVLAVVVWSTTLSLFVSSGLFWWVLPSDFKNQPSMRLQSHLMQREEVFSSTLVIGDSLFFQHLNTARPLQRIEINAFDPYDANFSLEQIEKLEKKRGIEAKYCRVFIQISPYFLMRMTSRGKVQNVGYFSNLSDDETLFWPNSFSKRFFYTMQDFILWLGSAESDNTADRPSHFPIQLSKVDENLENWERLFKRIQSAKFPVTLVQDRAGSDYSNAPEVLEYFDTAFQRELTQGKYKLPNLNLVDLETARRELENRCEAKKT